MVTGPVEAVDDLQHEERCPQQRRRGRPPVGDVQPRPGAQHACHLDERPLLGGPVEVMQHQRADDGVGGGGLERQRVGQAAAPQHPLRAGLRARERQDLRIAVDGGDRDIGARLRHRDRKGTGARPDIDHVAVRGHAAQHAVAQERSPMLFAHRQRDRPVVAPRRTDAARCGHIP